MRKKATWWVVFALPVLAIGSYVGFEKSKPKVTLDEYLVSYGFHLTPQHSFNAVTRTGNEGYLSAAQAKQFQQQLLAHPHIKSIAEIGLNAGHSASAFFGACKGLKKFTSFDIKEYSYTDRAVEYFKEYYGKYFEFVEGDSNKTVVEYAEKFPSQKFDLIYVDGSHSFQGCLNDLGNCKRLAHPDTTVWVDDYNIPEVHSAIYTLVGQGLIEIDSVYASMSNYGERQWVKLRYRFP